MSNFGLGNKTS